MLQVKLLFYNGFLLYVTLKQCNIINYAWAPYGLYSSPLYRPHFLCPPPAPLPYVFLAMLHVTEFKKDRKKSYKTTT